MKRMKEEDLYVIRGRRPKTGVARASRPTVIHGIIWGGLITVLIAIGLLITIALLAPPLATDSDAVTPGAGDESQVSVLASDAPERGQTLILAHNRIDLDQALRTFAATFTQETGVALDIRLISGAQDYLGTLEQAAQQDERPDLFLLEQPADFLRFPGQLADLSAEPWAQDSAFAFGQDGKISGFPLDLQAMGFVCNLDLLNQAEIDPMTLNQVDAWKSALQTIERRKKQLGIQSAIALSMSSPNGMARTNTLALLDIYLGSGLTYSNQQLVEKLNAGSVETQRFQQYAEYLDLVFAYSDPQILASGTYADQLASFASGQTVFMLSSNWLEAELANNPVSFAYGFVPFGAYQPATNGLFIEPISYLVVNADSPQQESARQVLIHLAASMKNQSFLSDLPGTLPALTADSFAPDRPLIHDLAVWIQSKPIYGIHHSQVSEDISTRILIPLCTQLAARTMTSRQFIEQFTEQVAGLSTATP